MMNRNLITAAIAALALALTCVAGPVRADKAKTPPPSHPATWAYSESNNIHAETLRLSRDPDNKKMIEIMAWSPDPKAIPSCTVDGKTVTLKPFSGAYYGHIDLGTMPKASVVTAVISGHKQSLSIPFMLNKPRPWY